MAGILAGNIPGGIIGALTGGFSGGTTVGWDEGNMPAGAISIDDAVAGLYGDEGAFGGVDLGGAGDQVGIGDFMREQFAPGGDPQGGTGVAGPGSERTGGGGSEIGDALAGEGEYFSGGGVSGLSPVVGSGGGGFGAGSFLAPLKGVRTKGRQVIGGLNIPGSSKPDELNKFTKSLF